MVVEMMDSNKSEVVGFLGLCLKLCYRDNREGKNVEPNCKNKKVR